MTEKLTGYIALGINAKTQSLHVLSIAPDKQKCKTRAGKRAEKGMEFAVFNIFNPNLAFDLRNWLVIMDVPLDEIPQIIQQLGKSIREIMEEK